MRAERPRPSVVCRGIPQGFGSCCKNDKRPRHVIIYLRLDAKEGLLDHNVVYTPQIGCPECDKDNFRTMLEEAIKFVPEGDCLSVAGDMNGHVESAR